MLCELAGLYHVFVQGGKIVHVAKDCICESLSHTHKSIDHPHNSSSNEELNEFMMHLKLNTTVSVMTINFGSRTSRDYIIAKKSSH